ncbi:unnamed protein product [Orchesella dallaii]|uniref:Fragile site-associated protein C-terminal domain-containing protein n=1 Tax=Orchesella dallaii TaxID=48710 RepID=A0ABP1R5E3_9HEXA
MNVGFSSVSSSVEGWSHVGESEKLVGESGRSTPGTAATNKRLNRSDIIRQVNEWNESNEAAAAVSGSNAEKDEQLRGGGHMGKRHFSSEQSHEESLLLGAHSKFPQHPSLMLLDAHVIFKPLLTSMGLMPHQIMGYSFDHLGSHMSIKAAIDMLRIDIVESEMKGIGRRQPAHNNSSSSSSAQQQQQQGKGSANSSASSPFVLNIAPEVPAFLCEKIGLEGDFQKSADVSRDILNRRSMIYLSRNYWKKQAKSAIIFSVNIDYISQQVNMPLLRLLHQITTMYQNVRETQMELREQRPMMAAKERFQSTSVAGVPCTQIGGDLARSGSGARHKNSSSSDGDATTMMVDAKSGAVLGGGIFNRSSSFRKSSSYQNAGNAPSTATNTMSGTFSSALATRTQSFAQRFKKGSSALHHKLNFDGTIRNSSASQTPTSLRAPAEIIGAANSVPSAPVNASSSNTAIPPASSSVAAPPAPNCWRTIYYLLDLYATRPETKTVINNKPPLLTTASFKGGAKDVLDEAEKGQTSQEQMGATVVYATSSLEKQREHIFESPRISIFGIARIQRTRLLATLSGLKLEAEIMNLQASTSYKKRMRPAAVELSLTGHVGQSMIVLLEGVAPNQQTVVRVSVSKSGALYSSISRRLKERNSALLTVGPVVIDIPQHPVVLHGMMTRSTKQLSNTLQEFRVNRTASRISRGTTFDEVDFAAHLSHQVDTAHAVNQQQQTTATQRKASDSTFFQPLQMQFTIVLQSLSITAALLPSLQAQYKMEQVKSCGITGSKAKFQIRLPTHTLSFTTKLTMTSEANLPSAACISLPQVDVSAEYVQDEHGAIGKVKEEGSGAQGGPSTSNVPTATSDTGGGGGGGGGDDDVVLRKGSYLSAFADIGAFEHCLTTDLLNHLVFVQKVFMKEVNEVVLKMSGGDKPVPLWEDDGSSRSSMRSVLFSLFVRLQSIQITATTPTNTAVRLETGLLEFQMSNRVKTEEDDETDLYDTTTQSQQQQTSSSSHHPQQSAREKKKGHHHHHHHRPTHHPTSQQQQQQQQQPQHVHRGGGMDMNKVFIKAQVDVNLSLGQLIRNMVFEEADSEYQQYAFFKTRIGLRNVADMSTASPTITSEIQDKEVVLITLTRPLIYVQPIAVDKAILVWLNYKSAYEYWNEQRSSLNTEVMHCTTATEQQHHPAHHYHSHHGATASQHRLQPQAQAPAQPSQPQHGVPVLQSSTLFLQLTVDDMGISIPLNPSPHGLRGDSESRGAVVVTLESTSISACSSGSLVSKGRFTGLCFRFSDDMVSMDDWKPNLLDPTVMNFCVVSEGTYEVCSRTTSRKSSTMLEDKEQGHNAKWFLNVQWQMEGVDMHVDVNIGKQLSALGHTLTTLAAFEEDEDDDEEINEPGEADDRDDEYEEGRDDFGNAEDFPDSAGVAEEVGKSGRPSKAARSVSQESVILRRHRSTTTDNLPGFLTDPSVGPRQKRCMLEKEMQERISLIDELNKAGSPQSQIEEERRKLQELENVAFRDFRRDWIKKLRRQSTKAPSIRDKFSWSQSAKTLGNRSKSLAVTTPDSDKQPQWRQYSVDSGSATTPDDEDEFVGVWLDNEHQDNILMMDYNDDPEQGHAIGSQKEGGGVGGAQQQQGHMTPGSSVSHTTKAQEPNVDLELDVKVFINSGKCVLHTKPKGEEDDASQRRKRSERSGSGYDSLLHISSPISSRKARHNLSSTRIKSPFGVPGAVTDVTTFHIPGLDVKIHYDSHTLYDDRDSLPKTDWASGEASVVGNTISTPPFTSTMGTKACTHERSDSGSSAGGSNGGAGGPLFLSSSRRSGTKRASMFAWITLHSVPEETIISPHILDFLEQTLEPIPIPVVSANSNGPTPSNKPPVEGSSSDGRPEDEEDAVTSTYYASFPVDVIVYFHMQPSTFRFSCQPVSRVECMLRLPALDIVFSSKRAEEEYEHTGEQTGAPLSIGKGKLHHYHHHHHPSFSSSSSSASFRNKFRYSPADERSNDKANLSSSSGAAATVLPTSSIIGGLSVTGCLSDFSLYIFHPYGAAKKSDQWSPLSDNERKDSVSMNVEFVKFHLSRSRKVHVTLSGANAASVFMDQGPWGVNSPLNTAPNNNSTTTTSSSSHQAAIRFSSIAKH